VTTYAVGTLISDIFYPGLVYAVKCCSEQGEGRQAYLLVSVLTLLLFAQFTVMFNEEQLIFFLPLKLQLQKLAYQWQDSHCLKTELEGLHKPCLLLAGNQPARPCIVC